MGNRLNNRSSEFEKKPLLMNSDSSQPSDQTITSPLAGIGNKVTQLSVDSQNFFDKLEDKRVSMSPLDSLYDSKFGFIVLKGAKYCMRIFGLFMVMVAVVLLSLNFYFYFAVTLPMMNTQMWTYTFHLLLGLYIALSISFNYVQCVRVSPGVTPKEWVDSLDNVETFRNDTKSVPGKNWSKWCGRCQQPKPIRAHHCHICDVCVLRMDHHCPWLNNCVGLQNHKYFVGFIGFLALAALYNFVMISLGVFGFYTPDPILYATWSGWLTFVMVLSGSLGLTMTTFTGWHVYLVLTNQTTIEFQFNKMKAVRSKSGGSDNPYNIGMKSNIQQVYGLATPEDSVLGWAKLLMLPNLQKSPVDGINYPTNQPKGGENV
ncbi:hypothetical protein C9374_013160 [Naegleria lovaniensis]|nr:uncharacterized protein C9374_013160 [Naegleria lovaniensis]KAG2372796.1 hypothetical protein C9374_013160 [Naegleria lovaniensis]